MARAGIYNAKAVDAAVGVSNTGKEQIAVCFELTDGEFKGEQITWYGYFTEVSIDKTVKSLVNAGFNGDDFRDLSSIKGEVSLTLSEEEYDGKKILKVAWVNKIGEGNLRLKNRLDKKEMDDFANRMNGYLKSSMPAIKPKTSDLDEDDIPF